MSEYKNCPYCAEQILAKAVKCKHCQSTMEEMPADKQEKDPADTAPDPEEKVSATPPPPPPPPPPAGHGVATATSTGNKGGFWKTFGIVLGTVIGLAALGFAALVVYHLIVPTEIEVINVKTATEITVDGYPVNPTDKFYVDAGQIFLTMEVKNAPSGTKLTSNWYYEDEDALFVNAFFEIPQGDSTPYFYFVPEADWPEGSYRIELTIDDEIVATARFQVEVKTGTISYAWEGEPGEYHGQLRSGVPHGYGTWQGASDGIYEGEWADGQFHGYGTFDSSYVFYEGDWVENVPHGFGTLTIYGDFSYTGGFKEGNLHGEGVLTEADGTVTEGTWIDGELVE